MRFAVFAGLFLAIFIPTLTDLGYWPLDAETVIYGGLSLVLAGLFTLIGRFHPSVDRFLIGLLVYWIADAFFFDGPAIPVIAGIAVLVLLHTRLENTLRPMLMIFGLVFVVSNVAVGGRPLLTETAAKASSSAASQPADKRPPIVHIILDAFMSPQAGARNGTLDHTLAETIADDYVKRGFRLYASARSANYYTHVSVSNMLGLGDQSQPVDYNVQRVHEDLHLIRNNLWARHLKSLGYRITTIGNDYIDLCTAEIDECYTYRAYGDGHLVSRFGIGFPQRTAIALRTIDRRWYKKGDTGKVALYREIDKLLTKTGLRSQPIDVSAARIASTLTVLDELSSRVGDIRPGEVYLAHILLPHTPYILNQDCGLEPSSKWVPRNELTMSDAESYERFSQQMICTHRRTLALIDSVVASPSGKDAIFFIHGDHGARHASNVEDLEGVNLETLPPEFVSDMLDPLFAVRAPGVVEPGIDADPVLMQAEFRDLFLQAVK
jgi:hypothetical protein